MLLERMISIRNIREYECYCCNGTLRNRYYEDKDLFFCTKCPIVLRESWIKKIKEDYYGA